MPDNVPMVSAHQERFRRFALTAGIIGGLIGLIIALNSAYRIWDVRDSQKSFDTASGVVRRYIEQHRSGPAKELELIADPVIQIGQDGIKEATFGSRGQITSVRMNDGTVRYPAPGAGSSSTGLLVLLAFPLIGFLVPWGGVLLLSRVVPHR